MYSFWINGIYMYMSKPPDATKERPNILFSKKYNVEMPIVEQVYKVLYEDKSPAEAVNDLMNRALKSEF